MSRRGLCVSALEAALAPSLAPSTDSQHDAMVSLLPFHPKSRQAVSKAAGEQQQFASAYDQFRAELIKNIPAENRHDRHTVCVTLVMLENTLRMTGDEGVRYRSLLAVSILKNATATPSPVELEQARVALFPHEDTFSQDKMDIICELVSRLRSLVGLKQLHEAVALALPAAKHNPTHIPDPLPSRQLDGHEKQLSSSPSHDSECARVFGSVGRALACDLADQHTPGPSYSYLADEPTWKCPDREVRGEPRENGGSREQSSAAPKSSSASSGLSLLELVQCMQELFPEGETLSKHLFALIESDKGVGELQGEMIDLLGFDHFELAGRILETRQSLRDEMQAARRANPKLSTFNAQSLVPVANAGGGGNLCQQVVVQSRAQAEARKEARREQKRTQRELNRITHAFGEEQKLELELAQREMMRQKQLEMEQLKWTPLSQRVQGAPREMYPFVFDAAQDAAQTILNVNGMKYSLPVGSERLNHRTHEEVKVPAADRGSVQDVQHVYIKDMDELGQLGFKGFEKLNVIQSLVFEQAYKTKENLLICAPTGAGKTNIAMLTILNTIHEHRRPNGEIVKDDFKIIYIAPMKALATEMTDSFGKRLAPLGLKVRELTGDTQLSKKEIAETQMLVLTPEKWDVVTRKTGDNDLTSLVRLLIIDEVHLLHDDRGPVIETIVARTLRQVEMSQTGIRIVGLSATLPNYVDVARFLRVNPYKGLFFFDGRFRPVPLTQKFIGIKKNGGIREMQQTMDEVCYDQVVDFVRRGHQVLVFVHARNATTRLAQFFRERAATLGHKECFLPQNVQDIKYLDAKKKVQASRNAQLFDIMQSGFGVHHAGLARADRILMERTFAGGHVQVLFCTSTLAWGVNLPAHAVVIRGTDVFDAEKGAFSDLGVLDVQQIFGRAGRPQFENEGHGIIITWHKTMDKYLAMLVRQAPIESQFFKRVHDNLNAEITLGTVSNLEEAVEWLSYSYYHIRAKKNPMAYGLPHNINEKDPELFEQSTKQMREVAEQLDRLHMIRYDSLNGFLSPTDMGRIASAFYIKHQTIETIHSPGQPVTMSPFMPDDMVLGLISEATEFAQIKIREEECMDLEELVSYGCMLPIRGGGLASIPGKVNCLLQTLISRTRIQSFSLSSEQMYVEQNASRLCRAMFEMVLRKGWAHAANSFHTISKAIEKKLWPNQSALRQLVPDFVRAEWVDKVERRKMSEAQLSDLTAKELGYMFSCDGDKLYAAFRMLPRVDCEAVLKPITHTIIQVEAIVTPAFEWNDRLLGKSGAQSFWVLLENINENLIVHHEKLAINKKKVQMREPQRLLFTIPIRDRELSNVFQLRISSDYFMVDDTVVPLSMHNCVLPASCKGHTDLLPLDPLPISTLRNPMFEQIFPYSFFNPIQTQVFHSLYKTDESVLIGAPTGSGKTVCAELAIFRLLQDKPGKKVVYIAPLKALVRERVADWKEKFEKGMGYRVLELTGDFTPDSAALNAAPILITTPEKWDGVTRSWSTREYVQNVGLVVIDEIHLLGVDRGAVLEAIVTRLKLLTRQSCIRSEPARLVGLSTALANAGDVADWLGIKDSGLYNFRPSVRPVPISVHIAGFPGQHYCPRMGLMNKPAFKAILTYSPLKPTLVFVASRRQTRLTAMAFVSHLVTQDDPRQWLHMDMGELECLLQTVKDENLKLTLPFGIGMHHAGLAQHERNLVEQLYLDRKIQVLIATATLAWGVNLPAHLVIVKGTEFFDGKTGKYVDFPVTDVLQMMGRAGRPQFDTSACAVVYVQDVKKNFYKRFLYEPFPVESSLLPALANHVNAEVCAGTIKSRQGVMEYLAGTYLYRRLFANPNYYGIEDTSPEALTAFLMQTVDGVLEELVQSKCIQIDEEDGSVLASPYGRLASIYYLEHTTVRHFLNEMRRGMGVEQLLKTLCYCPQYAEIPVRHNEEMVNAQLQRRLRWKFPNDELDSPHCKAHLLFQAHFSRLDLPTDYRTDQRSVVDQCIRILQAMRDICVMRGWMSSASAVCILQQMCHQGRWWDDHPLLCLPAVKTHDAASIGQSTTIPQLQDQWRVDRAQGTDEIKKRARKTLGEKTTMQMGEIDEVAVAVCRWPMLQFNWIKLIRQGGGEKLIDPLPTRPEWIPVKAGETLRVHAHCQMLGPNRFNAEAFLPRWTKEKSAGWHVLMGDTDCDCLDAIGYAAAVAGTRTIRVEWKVPDVKGRRQISVFVMSDCYMGIDQQFTLNVDVQ